MAVQKRPKFPMNPTAPYQQNLLDWLARHQVNTALAPSEQAITNQRTTLLRDTKTQSNALSAAYSAAAKMLEPVSGEIEGIYKRAGDTTAGYAKGVSNLAGEQRTAAGVAGSADAAGTLTPDQQAMLSRSYNSDPSITSGLYGYIPGASLAQAGAGYSASAALQPGITRQTGLDALSALRFKAQGDDSDLAQQVKDIEAKRPGLLDQAYTSLYQQENSKNATRVQQGYLQLQTAKTAQDEAIAMTNMTGYLYRVNKKGQAAPVLGADGKPYYAYGSDAETNRVAGVNAANSSSNPKTKAADRRRAVVAARGDQISTSHTNVTEAATDWLGKPVANPRAGRILSKGTYLAMPGKSEYKDGTTDDEHNARRAGALSWSQAKARAYALVADDLRRYGVKPARIRALVTQWLVGAGMVAPIVKKVAPPTSKADTPRVGAGPGERPN